MRNARVQVYVRVESDLSSARELDVPPCATVVALTSPPCIQSVLKVAHGTTDANGELTLLLPPALN